MTLSKMARSGTPLAVLLVAFSGCATRSVVADPCERAGYFKRGAMDLSPGYYTALDETLAISAQAQAEREAVGLKPQTPSQAMIYARLNSLERRCWQQRER